MSENTDKKVAIIGGGISGLISGILYLRKKYQVTIFEKNRYLGGAFKDSITYGYANNFMLVGSNDEVRNKINEVIDFSFLDIKDTDYIYLYKGKEKDIYFYKDINKFKTELMNLFPFEEKVIYELINGISCASKLDYSFKEKKGLFVFFNNPEKQLADFFNKYGKKSINQFCDDIKDEDFKNSLIRFVEKRNTIALLMLVMGLYSSNKIQYVNNKPEILDRLINEFSDNGGIVKLNSEVRLINNNKDKNSIIYGSDDKEEYFDKIVYAGDCYNLFNMLLPKKYYGVNAKVYFENYVNSKSTSFFVCTYDINLKNREKLQSLINSGYLSFTIDNRFRVGTRINDEFKLIVNDNQLTVLFNQCDDDYEFFKLLSKNPIKYKAEINRIENDVENILEANLGVNRLSLEKIITPLDFGDEFNHYKGGINGLLFSPEMMGATLNNYVNGIDNFVITNAGLMKPFWFYSAVICALKGCNSLSEEDNNKK